MLHTDKLTDAQLVALWRNRKIKGVVKRMIVAEVSRRAAAGELADMPKLEYEPETLYPSGKPLTIGEKMIVLLLPALLVLGGKWLVLLQVFLSCKHLWDGNMEGNKEYWKYLTVSYAVWVAIVLVGGKYVIANL